MLYKINIFNKLNKAYNLGKKDYIKGKSIKDSPFIKSDGTKNFDEYNQWVRGWLSESIKNE